MYKYKSAFVIREPEGNRYVAFGLPPRVSANSVQLPKRYEKMAYAFNGLDDPQTAFEHLFAFASQIAKRLAT